jgi:hypothetical protein
MGLSPATERAQLKQGCYQWEASNFSPATDIRTSVNRGDMWPGNHSHVVQANGTWGEASRYVRELVTDSRDRAIESPPRWRPKVSWSTTTAGGDYRM